MDEHVENKVDKLFRDSLQHYENEPSGNIWANIETELNKDDKKITSLQNRRKVYMTAGLLISLVGLGMILNFQLSQHKTQVAKYSIRNSNKTKATTANNSARSRDDQSRHDLTKNSTWSKNLNYSERNIAKEFEYESSAVDSGKTNIHSMPIQVTESELTSFHTHQIVFPAAIGLNDKLIVRHQRQSFKDRFSITPYFSQEFAGYNFIDDDSTSPTGKEIEQRERNVFSASVGIYINYTFNNRWVLQSGIGYSWSRSNIDSSTCYAVNDNNGNVQFKLNTVSGYGYLQPSSAVQPSVGDSVSAAKAYSRLHYLTVPLILSYNFPLNRFSLLVGGGVTFNLLTSATIETNTYGSGYPEKEYVVNMMGLKKINYGIVLKADLEYHMSYRVGINLIPSFKNTLSPINLQSAISAYPYNFGIGLGLTYQF
jgi:hypothetical protein